MALLNLAIELAETNRHLARIADALDRLSPVIAQGDRPAHPLIGVSDISRYRPHSAAERDTMAIRASQHVRFSDGSHSAETGSGASAEQVAAPIATPISRVGQFDMDDPLDDFPELDREWPNYAG